MPALMQIRLRVPYQNQGAYVLAQHLNNLAAHRLAEQAEAHREQQHPQLGLDVPAHRGAAHDWASTQFTRVRMP